MQIRLHKQARTTPALRREIRDSKLSIKELARRYGLESHHSAQVAYRLPV